MNHPSVTLTALPAADGSASYTHAGYTVLAAVNGPLEAPRRDEHPSEAHLELTVREATGQTGPRERALEAAAHAALAPLLRAAAYPRALFQLSLQLVQGPAVQAPAPEPQRASALAALPHLLNAAVCALLDGGVAMRRVAMAVGVAVGADGDVVVVVGGGEDKKGAAVDVVARLVFAFEGGGRLLLAESEGGVSLEAWRRAAARAREVCCGGSAGAAGDGEGGLLGWLRSTVAQDLDAKGRWRESR